MNAKYSAEAAAQLKIHRAEELCSSRALTWLSNSFSLFVVISPLLQLALSIAGWHIGQHIWLTLFAVLAFFILFLCSPAYDLATHLGQLRGLNQKNLPRKHRTLAEILRGNGSLANLNLRVEDLRGILDIFQQRAGSWRPFFMLTIAMVIGAIIQFVIGVWSARVLALSFVQVLILSTTFPLLAAYTLAAWKSGKQRFHLTEIRKIGLPKKNSLLILQSLKTGFVEKINRIATYEFPVASIYLSFLTASYMIVFWPLNAGYSIADWLLLSARDANIFHKSAVADPYFVFAVSIFLYIILCRAFTPLAWRLGFFYQLFLQKLIMGTTGHGIQEAITDAVSLPRTKISMRPQHPNLRTVRESIQWIAICYGTLFCLIAFCPGPLGQAITNWLDASIADAGLHFGLAGHFNLRLFLAAIFAAYGTAPFAIMSCAFLPLRRPDQILASEQGLLQPNKLLGPPLLYWQDLRKVVLVGTNNSERSRQVLKFIFRPGTTLKIRLNTVSKENLVQLLMMADEHTINCQLDDAVIKLRTELAKETRSALAQAKKFESTIFHPHLSGDKIHAGHLRIVRQLTSKPLSAVYFARTDESRLVVVKQFVTPNDDAISEKYKEMFKREYELISSLQHPMMAKLITIFEENNANYIVLERILGEDLRSIVQRHGPRPEWLVIAWAKQICELMHYLHNQNVPVLHRDLTPDNIMLDESGQIRIIDFGAAHQFMEGITGTLIGKQCYIAPEQLRGKATVRSDIYSFGCSLYFLLSGNDPRALSQSDLTGVNSKVSNSLQKFIKDCTEFEEVKRPQSFDEVMVLLDIAAIESRENMRIASISSRLLKKGSIEVCLPEVWKEPSL